MSADNYIFVAKFSDDSYRVKHVLGAYWETQEEAREEMERGQEYTDRATALLAAHDMYAEQDIVEYGVSEIDLTPQKGAV
jgi:hypothetical protein